MRKMILAVFAVLAAAMAMSCATTERFVIQVDSIGKDLYEGEKTYVVLPTDKDIKTGDLRFEEYAGYVEKALARKGYRRVAKAESANIVVYLTYGVGQPQEQHYSYTLPIYGQLPAPAIEAPAPGASPGAPPSSGAPHFSHSPVYGIVGSTVHTETYTTYFRFCKIEAFDLRRLAEGGEERQIWSTVVTSRGRSEDLRKVMPYLIAGAQDYLATDTGRQVEVVVDGDDGRLAAYR